MDLEEFKAVQEEVWARGDYRPIGRLLEPAARALVEAAGVRSGQRVLDVATGSGSVAVLAAQAGADVVGVDITDAWFDAARIRAAAAGVAVDLAIGDAEALPADDASFDVVLSGFGAIFAPRHDVVASELVRVCRPGGTIALTAWTPGGANDAVFSTLSARLPPPPEFVTPFVRWGEPDHVRQLFDPYPVRLEFARRSFDVAFESTDAFEAFVFTNSGPLVRGRRVLEELGEWEDTYAEFRRAVDASNEARDGTYRVQWDYLTTIASMAA